jgi:hypothetical protein
MQTYPQRFKTQNENQEFVYIQEMNLCCCFFYCYAMLIFVSVCMFLPFDFFLRNDKKITYMKVELLCFMIL